MENVIVANNISKVYKLYNKPIDRLKEALSPMKKKYYKEFFALNEVTFQIRKGEAVGIIGKNGSGKSTLLKLLTKVLNPSSGDIEINGKVSALLELGAGFNLEYTGIENIYLNGEIMGYNHKKMSTLVPEIIKFADIGDFVNQPVKAYSSGMFVRLAFAVAINVEPEILIIDEALSVGDVRFQLKCMDKIAEFLKSDKTVIFVSHDTNTIKRFCTRALWLNEGKLIMDGNADVVSDNYLDYLKTIDKQGYQEPQTFVKESMDYEVILEGIDIAVVKDLKIRDNNEIVDNIIHGHTITVEIEYMVKDIKIENPVLGIAIYSADDKYICGLNTLLDKKVIPWERGLNKYSLQYRNFNLIGGSYYFDVALLDKTATVRLDYKKKYHSFFVTMNYIAEGLVVLEHKWL